MICGIQGVPGDVGKEACDFDETMLKDMLKSTSGPFDKTILHGFHGCVPCGVFV